MKYKRRHKKVKKSRIEIFFKYGGAALLGSLITLFFTTISSLGTNYINSKREIDIKIMEINSTSASYAKTYKLQKIEPAKIEYYNFYDDFKSCFLIPTKKVLGYSVNILDNNPLSRKSKIDEWLTTNECNEIDAFRKRIAQYERVLPQRFELLDIEFTSKDGNNVTIYNHIGDMLNYALKFPLLYIAQSQDDRNKTRDELKKRFDNINNDHMEFCNIFNTLEISILKSDEVSRP